MINNKIFHSLKIKVIIFTMLGTLLSAFACQKKDTNISKVYNESKANFLSNINSFINKTPNELYSKWGKPNEYTTELNQKKQIVKANIIYEKVYNFKLQQFDCIITFSTDATQKKIVNVSYNSDKCFYLSYYTILPEEIEFENIQKKTQSIQQQIINVNNIEPEQKIEELNKTNTDNNTPDQLDNKPNTNTNTNTNTNANIVNENIEIRQATNQ